MSFTFGSPAAQPGAQQPAAPAPSFGGATGGTFSFGSPAAAAPAFGTTNTGGAFNFGTPASATQAAPPTTAPPSFNFSTPVAAKTAAPPSFNFGAPAVSTAPAATLSFGTVSPATATAAAAPTLGLGGGGFSFGKPPATAAATTSASLNFGTTTSAATFTPSTGLFGKPNMTLTTTAAAPVPFVGLGGVDMSANQPKAGDSKLDNVKVKETKVPEEIAKTVEDLKNYIKVQKTISSEIGRTSTSKLTYVANETTSLQWALQEIANSVEANYKQIKLLRAETSNTIQTVEMAQRTQDTPAGLQFENNAPFQYFKNIVAKYEQDLLNFRQQISFTERHMRSLINPQNSSPKDLKSALEHINESFISLAGRLQEIHQKVEAQKEQFINLRKYRLNDSTNVFASIDVVEDKVDTTRITAGPTPFSNISAISNFGKSFANSSAASGSGNTATAQSGQ